MALTPREIFDAAIAGGFTPEQAVTMTAVALAESSGRTDALAENAHEESVGLWQINLHAHQAMVTERGWDLTDPVDNARAAYEVSMGGQKINPWTVTHHKDGGEPRYFQHIEAAETAAAEAGFPGLKANAFGSGGYGADNMPAALSAVDPNTVVTPDAQVANPVPDDGPTAATPQPVPEDTVDGEYADRVGSFADMSEESLGFVNQQDDGVPVGEFLRNALGQDGDRYVYGADPDPNDPNPDVFDCAELVQWSLERLGAPNPGGSTNEQQHWLRNPDNGAIAIPVELAKEIPGAVIYSVSSSRAASGDGNYAGHVAISLGNGETIEARGKDWGVGSWDIGDRFQHAFLLPGVDYTDLDGLGDGELDARADGVRFAAGNVGTADSDHDMLADHFEIMYGLDPANPDMDGDGITDGYEILVLGTDAMSSDSDRDWLSDEVELLLGFDPTIADNPDADVAGVNVAPDEWLDSDGDGIVDWAERNLGFDPDDADTDDDGIIDSLESDALGGLTPVDDLDDATLTAMTDTLDAGLNDGT